MRRLFVLFAILGTLFAISGCGNKGPLYLPPEPVEQTESSTPDANQG